MLGRYFKFTSNGSSVNASNHWIEIQIFDTNGENVALNKGLLFYSNADPGALEQFRNPATVTDNNTTGNYFDMGGGEQYLIIDIGQIKNIAYIKMWRYYGDRRTYYGTLVEVSIDNEGYETVFSSVVNGTYSESSAGKRIDMPPAQSYSGKFEVLEYIQSSGTQYINTEVVPTENTNVEIKYSVQEILTLGPHILSTLNWYCPFLRKRENDTPAFLYYRMGTEGFAEMPEVQNENAIYTIKAFPNNQIVINGETIKTGVVCGSIAGTTPLYMFTYGGDPGSALYTGKTRVYYCKIWNGDLLVKNFFPVKLDIGFCGLWDSVSNKFYCNIGTGEFIAGPNFVPTKIIIRSGSTLYTVTDNTLTALTETEVTASLLQTYGVDDLPDGALLATLTDPEVLYWQDSEDELPALSMTVKGTPPLPQMFTSEPMDLTHESIAGIDHAVVDASEDVRFVISFDDGATWKAFDGSAWFDVSDTAPGMAPSTMNAITAEQWAEVVRPTAYRLRFWLPNVTAYVASVVIHYINP